MTRQQKYDFRMSNKWKHFRLKCKQAANYFDFITKQPLSKTCNLHHLDLRDKHYTDISNIKRFLPLNKDTHDFIHWLYTLWYKDKDILSRIKIVLEEMYNYTHDKVEDNNGH